MAPITSSAEKIVEGGIRAVGRYGLRKFSMSDVCTESGVSRGTLYRYFKSKDQILEAIGEYVERTLKTTIDEAVEAHPDPAERLEVVLQALLDYRTAHPDIVRIVESESSVVLELLSREFTRLLAIVSDALDPVLRDAPPVRDGTLTKRQLAEMFIRLTLSAYLVPSAGSDQIATRVAALWRSVTASPVSPARGKARRAAG